MSNAQFCSRCGQNPTTTGQRWCAACKRASKNASRPSWAGGISAFLRRRSTRPILSDTEPLQDGPVVELEAEAEADLIASALASSPPVEPDAIPVEEQPTPVLTVTLSLDAEIWADLDEAASRDCVTVDQFLSRKLEEMRSLYAAL